MAQPSQQTPLIEVRDLERTFDVRRRVEGRRRRVREQVRAVHDLTFSVQPGELVGYIGPNGVGKSTTVKVLTGILVPDAERCEVAGHVPRKERIPHVRQIGVVFGRHTQLWWDLPVIESLDLLRDICGVPDREYRHACDGLVALLRLEPLLDMPVRQLSLGQRGHAGAPAVARSVSWGVLLLVALRIWHVGVRHSHSTGS
jgi:ABC-2 type transport system ATP-binding protein